MEDNIMYGTFSRSINSGLQDRRRNVAGCIELCLKKYRDAQKFWSHFQCLSHVSPDQLPATQIPKHNSRIPGLAFCTSPCSARRFTFFIGSGNETGHEGHHEDMNLDDLQLQLQPRKPYLRRRACFCQDQEGPKTYQHGVITGLTRCTEVSKLVLPV